MLFLTIQLPFLANEDAELDVLLLFWPVNCIKIVGHFALLSDPTDYSIYCVQTNGKKLARHFLIIDIPLIFILNCLTTLSGGPTRV